MADETPGVKPSEPGTWEWRSWLFRLLLAIALGIGIPLALAATAWSHERPYVERGSARGYSDGELRAQETPDEAKIRQIRDQEITELRITLGRRLAPNRRADLYLRLAEIYIEAYRQDFILEGRVHDKHLDAHESEEFIDHSHSKRELANGLKAAHDILALGIRVQKMDEVYYFLGFNEGELGNTKESLAYFQELIRRFPDSPYVSEGYRQLGDHAFERRDFGKAQAYYQLAASHADAENQPRLLHKLAWSYYRTRQYDKAVDTMKAAISALAKGGDKFLSLKEEALRDMAVFMTEQGRVDEALGYFQKVAGDKQYYPKALERLGAQYERDAEPQKAAQVYETLLRTHPESESAFRVNVKLVQIDLKLGHFKEAVARLMRMQIPTSGEQETLVAAQNLRALVRHTATEHHEAYRKHGQRADLEVAELFYQAYRDAFLAKDDPRDETPEIQMYLAEVKRDLGKSEEASNLYRSVIDSKDKRYAKQAGALWTASLSEAIRNETKGGHARKNADEPSPLERQFVDAADRMTDALGDAPEGREAALKATEVLAGYRGTRKEAVQRIQRMIRRWPSSPQALTAAKLWIQMLTDALPPAGTATTASGGALDDLKEAIQEIRANAALMANDQAAGGKLRLTLADQDTRFRVLLIAKEEKENDYADAAKGYESFAAEASLSGLAEKAYVSAMTNYTKAGDADSVERLSGEWLKRFPDSAKATEMIRGSATQFLIDGAFDRAARLFEHLGRTGKDSVSLQTAARLYEGNGDYPRAQAAWSAYLDLYRDTSPDERATVLVALAKSLEESKQDAEAARYYKECMRLDASGYPAECGARLADIYFRGADDQSARNTLKRVAMTGPAEHRGRRRPSESEGELSPYVAYARFKLANLMENDARFEPLALPEAQLKRAMNQRLEFLEPLSRAYSGALDAGGPWGIAALDRLAAWAWEFADEMDRIAPPAGAPPAQIAQFKENVKAVSDSLRKKALSTWTDAYAKASSMGALSAVVPTIADRLADARAPRPGRAQGPRGRFRLAGVAADGGSDGQSAAFKKARARLTKSVQDGAAWVDYGNLLWGQGKPLLAKIAYEYALKLNARNPAALNNRGVIAATGDGEEDWARAAEAQHLFQQALKADEFFLPAKLNWALLLNYYRMFSKAQPLWRQVRARNQGPDVEDGIAVAEQGLGQFAEAEASFKKATDLGASSSRFTRVFNEAAQMASAGRQGAAKCASMLSDLSDASLQGFEKTAVADLRRVCAERSAVAEVSK